MEMCRTAHAVGYDAGQSIWYASIECINAMFGQGNTIDVYVWTGVGDAYRPIVYHGMGRIRVRK